jgi:uncharacterized membrane protein YkoI
MSETLVARLASTEFKTMQKVLPYSITAFAIAIGNMLTIDANGQSPNRSSLQIIEVVQRLEQAGYGPFTELSMDDGNWEVECRKQGESLELTVDAVSGKVLSEHRDDAEPTPTADAMALSKLLQTIHDQKNYERFIEVSFERRYWEVEVYTKGQKYELLVDPITAKVITERTDD